MSQLNSIKCCIVDPIPDWQDFWNRPPSKTVPNIPALPVPQFMWWPNWRDTTPVLDFQRLIKESERINMPVTCNQSDDKSSAVLPTRIYQDEQNIVVEVGVTRPGVSKDMLRVDINGNELTITLKAFRHGPQDDTKLMSLWHEPGMLQLRTPLELTRTFQLPCVVDEAQIEATYENSILRIVFKDAIRKKHNIPIG